MVPVFAVVLAAAGVAWAWLLPTPQAVALGVILAVAIVAVLCRLIMRSERSSTAADGPEGLLLGFVCAGGAVFVVSLLVARFVIWLVQPLVAA